MRKYVMVDQLLHLSNNYLSVLPINRHRMYELVFAYSNVKLGKMFQCRKRAVVFQFAKNSQPLARANGRGVVLRLISLISSLWIKLFSWVAFN